MSERQPAAVLVLGIYILTLTQHKVKVTPLPLKCGESPDEHGLQHEMGLQTVKPNEILERVTQKLNKWCWISKKKHYCMRCTHPQFNIAMEHFFCRQICEIICISMGRFP